MTFNVLKTVFSPVIGVAFGLMLFAASSPAHAQGEALDCDTQNTQAEMNMCAAQEYERADKELNEMYQQAIKKLKADAPERLESFRDVQRAWLKFRDMNCDYQSALYEGGSMRPMVHSLCLTELTQERTHKIPALFDDWPKN